MILNTHSHYSTTTGVGDAGPRYGVRIRYGRGAGGGHGDGVFDGGYGYCCVEDAADGMGYGRGALARHEGGGTPVFAEVG